jgi:hypothetical protein
MSINYVEIHGCIICARLFNILVVATPDGKLLDCTVTSPGGNIVPDERKPLVVCNTHTAVEIELAYKRLRTMKNQNQGEE